MPQEELINADNLPSDLALPHPDLIWNIPIAVEMHFSAQAEGCERLVGIDRRYVMRLGDFMRIDLGKFINDDIRQIVKIAGREGA